MQYSQRKLSELQNHYDLLSEKVSRLRQAQAIEVDAAIKFKLEKQLEQAEAERDALAEQIEAVERKLGEPNIPQEEDDGSILDEMESTGKPSLQTGSVTERDVPIQAQRGIPSDILNRLRTVLLDCGPFDSNKDLRAVFVDKELNPWRDRLDETDNRIDRVDRLIALLHDTYNIKQENVLILFLHVILKRTKPDDSCRQRLAELMEEL